MKHSCNSLPNSLVGIWSHDVLFSPGAAADELLVFRPDGTGVVEIYNWVLCSYNTFVWQIENDVRLTIKGQQFFESATTSIPSDLHMSHADFHITSEQTPVFGVIDVLHLTLGHWLPDRYGRTGADITGYLLPEFDRTV